MKRVTCLVILVALAGFSGVGFSGVNDQMQSWVGSSAHDLILQFGPPTRIMPDGNGGEILIYGGEQTINTDRGAVYSSHSKVREYYVDKDGIIYSWRWKGAGLLDLFSGGRSTRPTAAPTPASALTQSQIDAQAEAWIQAQKPPARVVPTSTPAEVGTFLAPAPVGSSFFVPRPDHELVGQHMYMVALRSASGVFIRKFRGFSEVEARAFYANSRPADTIMVIQDSGITVTP